MIQITNINERAPRAVAKAQRTKPFVRKVDNNTYIVTPRRISKQRRRVTFKVINNIRFADCHDHHTGEQCPAVAGGFICYHIARAALHAEPLRQRRVARRVAQPQEQQAAPVAAVAQQPAQSGPIPNWYNATKINGIRI